MTRLPARLAAACGLVGMLGLLMSVPAHAQFTPTTAPARAPTGVTESCTATVAGEPVARHRSASKPIHIRHDAVIRVEGQAQGQVSDVEYELKVAGRSVDFGESFQTNGSTWSGEVRVEDYAWAGVGLYEVVGVADTLAGECRDRVFICIDGKSPFATAAGGVAAAAGVGGLTMLWRALARRRRDPGGRASFGRLAIGGGLAAAGVVVLMQQFCIRPLTPLMLSIVPLGAVLAGTVAMIHGRGMPVPWSGAAGTPAVPPAQPEQPRTEAKNIYQFRAPSNACKACRQHALNKVFASAEAMRRAHKGCQCTIDWRPVDPTTYAGYFRAGPEYDPRRAR